MTDEYKSGKGHPIKVDKPKKTIEYSDEEHGSNTYVMCPRPAFNCHNDVIQVKDYANHLLQKHKMKIDPVQDRLMKSSAMVLYRFRKSKYVWAPFFYQIPETIYEMHLREIIREKEGTPQK